MNESKPAARNLVSLDGDWAEETLIGARKKILFVDDDKDWRERVSVCLGDCGYEVLTAPDTTEAVRRPDKATLALIILDLGLAGEDGLVLLRVRQGPLANFCPAVEMAAA